MTKQEVIAEIMYELKMSSSVSFEVDEVVSGSIDKDENGYHMKWTDGASQNGMDTKHASDVRTTLAKLGKTIIQL